MWDWIEKKVLVRTSYFQYNSIQNYRLMHVRMYVVLRIPCCSLREPLGNGNPLSNMHTYHS